MDRQVLVEEALGTIPETTLGLDDLMSQGSEEIGHLAFVHLI
jgi:hypothetical protein